MFKINFFICVSRSSKFVLSCVQSILNQKNASINKIYLIINSPHKTSIQQKIRKLGIGYKKIEIVIEREKGIPFARNKCLEIIRKTNSDFSCFTDDDCELSKNCLEKMIKLYKETKAEIITGPQISKNQNIFEVILERKAKHKSLVRWAATNNIFIKSKTLINNKLKFNEKLKNMGGSDQLFFSKLNLMGKKIYWNEEAKVFENRDKSLTNFKWFIRRNIRYGSSSKKIYFELYGPYKASLIILTKFLLEIMKSVTYLLIFPLNIKIYLLKSIQFFIRSIFTIIGIFNLKVDEYKT